MPPADPACEQWSCHYAPDAMERLAKTGRDTAVAAGIDRVLAAERECETAIQSAEAHAADRLERARAFRRTLLARMQGRITALHARVAAALEDDAERVRDEIAQIRRTDQDPIQQRSIEESIQTLAARLTGVADSDDERG